METVFEVNEVGIKAFDTKPLPNFQYPKDTATGREFPNCCKNHRDFFHVITEWFDEFPNCCDEHRKISMQPGFKKDDYTYVPSKIMNQIIYTEYHIVSKIDDEDWYRDIIDYIEYNIFSFGQPSIGLDRYLGYLKNYLKTAVKVEIPSEKRNKLIAYLEKPDSAKNEKPVNLNVLIECYKRWLSFFPFNIEYFKGLKVQFQSQLPIIRGGTTVTNRYTGMTKGTLHNEESLVQVLFNTTKAILERVKTSEFVNSGILKDINSHRLDLINEDHRIKQESLLRNFTKGENKYVNVLKHWLANEKQYFKDIEPLISSRSIDIPRAETNQDKLNTTLAKYGFFELGKVKALAPAKQIQLVDLISKNKLPYQIAMFFFLGFLEHLSANYFKEKYKLHKEISKWFNSSKDGRAVKGQISSLQPKTVEDKRRYTAYLHKEKVEKDYQNLK